MNVSRKKGPLYLQIKNILKDRILHGVYPIEMNIPSEPQLESEFNVSKITIRNAIQELVQEGYLEKKSGKGTKVIQNKSTAKLSKGKRFTEILVEQGHRVQRKLLSIEIIENQKESEIHQLFGSKCVKIERLYYLDDIPYIHYTHYLKPEQMKDLEPEDLNSRSLYDLIEENQIHLENFRDQFSVGVAPQKIEALLKINKANAPLLKRLRYSYNDSEEVIEFSEGFYNTEIQQYIVNYGL